MITVGLRDFAVGYTSGVHCCLRWQYLDTIGSIGRQSGYIGTFKDAMPASFSCTEESTGEVGFGELSDESEIHIRPQYPTSQFIPKTPWKFAAPNQTP